MCQGLCKEALNIFFKLSQLSSERGIIKVILQMWKLRVREVKEHAQGHPESKRFRIWMWVYLTVKAFGTCLNTVGEKQIFLYPFRFFQPVQ